MPHWKPCAVSYAASLSSELNCLNSAHIFSSCYYLDFDKGLSGTHSKSPALPRRSLLEDRSYWTGRGKRKSSHILEKWVANGRMKRTGILNTCLKMPWYCEATSTCIRGKKENNVNYWYTWSQRSKMAFENADPTNSGRALLGTCRGKVIQMVLWRCPAESFVTNDGWIAVRHFLE